MNYYQIRSVLDLINLFILMAKQADQAVGEIFVNKLKQGINH